MRLSAKGEYGVRAILDVALHSGQGPAQVREIAKRQAIPERFLEQVMASLKKGGLLQSTRGSQGGYILARPASEISLADVIEVIEGPITLMECVDESSSKRCGQAGLCVVRNVWQDVQNSIVKVLKSATLDKMCKETEEKEKNTNLVYHI